MTVSESGSLANRTICVPFIEETYEVVINDAIKFREYVNPMILCYPEIFPENITVNFTMKDI